MYMPSPYVSLVRNFLREVERGGLDDVVVSQLVADDAVLRVRNAAGTVDERAGAAAIATFFTPSTGDGAPSPAWRPRWFDVRDRAAAAVFDVSTDGGLWGDHDVTVRVVFGMAGGKIRELWVDPVEADLVEAVR